jgi:hypothetical protein
MAATSLRAPFASKAISVAAKSGARSAVAIAVERVAMVRLLSKTRAPIQVRFLIVVVALCITFYAALQ